MKMLITIHFSLQLNIDQACFENVNANWIIYDSNNAVLISTNKKH